MVRLRSVLFRRPAALAAAGLLAVAGAPAQSEPVWRVDTFAAGDETTSLFIAATELGRRLVLETGAGHFLGVSISNGNVRFGLVPGFARPAPEPRPDSLPDAVVSHGEGVIREAWLIGPTGRYGHGVLGDAIEGSGVRVTTAGGGTLEAVLDTESVFEDRLARLADLTGDGEDEIMIVRSYLSAGAALSVYGVRGGALVRIAEAPPIGRPSRWLNPVGVADFDGDGAPEAAAVITLHIGGVLKIYALRGEVLVEMGAAPGFSNHAIGSRELGLSAIVDANGDGVPDMMVPDARRRAIRIVTFAGGVFAEIARLPLPARVQTALVPLPGDSRWPAIAVGLEDGTLALIHR